MEAPREAAYRQCKLSMLDEQTYQEASLFRGMRSTRVKWQTAAQGSRDSTIEARSGSSEKRILCKGLPVFHQRCLGECRERGAEHQSLPLLLCSVCCTHCEKMRFIVARRVPDTFTNTKAPVYVSSEEEKLQAGWMGWLTDIQSPLFT